MVRKSMEIKITSMSLVFFFAYLIPNENAETVAMIEAINDPPNHRYFCGLSKSCRRTIYLLECVILKTIRFV